MTMLTLSAIIGAMDADTIIGLAILGAVLIVMVCAVFWGRRTINRIASNGFSSAREIIKERRGG